jgi:amino acid adenylation domain-containing protein
MLPSFAATVVDSFDRQARDAPDRIAVRAEGRASTYGDLARRANQLARLLETYHVGARCRVGILLDHSVETLVAILGVLKAGAAYVPADPDTPGARLRQVLDDAKVEIVLTTTEHSRSSLGARLIYLDADAERLAEMPAELPGVRPAQQDPAYVIYSSGSTGRPKGIVISHGALWNYVSWANAVYLENRPADLPLHSALAFDLTVTSIFSPLTTGGVVVAYRPRRGEPPIGDVFKEDQVDLIKLTPSHLTLALEQPATPSRLRAFIVGGENLDTELARRVDERFGQRVAIFNEYGPTETTVGCMIHEYDRERDRRRSVPIGRPAANTRIYVLNERGESIGEHGVGELYVAGAGLALEYLNDPVLTGQRFLPDPFCPGALMYRTGDLARRLENGLLEFVGREDDQIKIRGHRIHLGEIRQVLMRHPAVCEAVIRRVEGPGSRSDLVAYYVAEREIDDRELRAITREYLPRAILPTMFVWLDRLPLTTNGKVDHRALQSLESVHRTSPGAAELPTNAVEREIAEIWCRLLDFKHVGIRESFFELGGDSLSAVQLMAELERAFGVRLPLSALYPEGSIETLARALESNRIREPLVELRRAGGPRLTFLLHAIGGEVLGYEALIRHLDPDRPVYGIQAVDTHLAGESPLCIQSIAARYVQAVRAVQPHGPYGLVGYSAGGTLAFEMAQQLRAAGEEIELLGIIDGDAPAPMTRTDRRTARDVVRWMINVGAWIVDDLLVSDLEDLKLRSRSKLKLIARRLGLSGRRTSSTEGAKPDIRDELGVPELTAQQIPWLEAYADAMRGYQPDPYKGRVTLFRARTFGLRQRVVRDRGWGRLADFVDVQVIKGNHASILRDPAVRHLAAAIDDCLSRPASSIDAERPAALASSLHQLSSDSE